MKKIISFLRVKLGSLLRIFLTKLFQFMVLYPQIFKGPWLLIKRDFPRIHLLCLKILRRFNIIGAEALVQRARGGQDHALSPLAQRILADLESSISLQSKE